MNNKVNINTIVKQAIVLTQPVWKSIALSNNIIINLETDLQNLPTINGNEAELREMLTNLIINSVDAMAQNGTINLRTYHDSDTVVIEVSDTGIGMTAEVKQRCFEPFFSTKEEQGIGFGLTLVHFIILRHEGQIAVASAPGKGTTVRIKLPIPTTPKDEAMVPATVARSRSWHVLVVVDEPIVREVVTKYLTAGGYTFETANHGREGVRQFYRGQFDLVITARAMPDMNGIKMARLIQKLNPKTPVIMLTGFGEMTTDVGEIPTGVDYLLSKPIVLV